MSRRLALLLAIATRCEVGAPGEDLQGHHARRVSGALGQSSEVAPLLGLFTLTAGVNDVPTPLLVDTGAPLTFVNPGSSVSRGPQRLRSLTIGGATLYDVPVVGDDPFGLAPLVGGVLGVNVICQFNATWDWQRRRFTLGDTPRGADVEAGETVIPFALRGGGTLQVAGADVRVPPTRIVVEAEVEGQRRALLLDTGASTSALRDDLVEALARGRSSVSIRVTTQDGVSRRRMLRVRSLRALGVDADAVAIVAYDRAALDHIAREVGGAVDGLLGADALQGHLLSIAYPEGRIRLRRYRDRGHVRDRWIRAGVILGRSGGAWRVQEVLAGTAAQRVGVPEGAAVLEVDGRVLQGLSLDAVDALLMGEAGAVRTMRTAVGEFAVPVEDVIPLR